MGFKDMEKSKLDAMKNQWDEEYKKFKAMKLNPLVLYGFGYILGWFLSFLFLPFHRLALPA